jgi:hypothetical protein
MGINYTIKEFSNVIFLLNLLDRGLFGYEGHKSAIFFGINAICTPILGCMSTLNTQDLLLGDNMSVNVTKIEYNAINAAISSEPSDFSSGHEASRA